MVNLLLGYLVACMSAVGGSNVQYSSVLNVIPG